MSGANENSRVLDLGFNENRSRLQARIDANVRFAAFDLNEWLLLNIAISRGSRLADLGCGSGNHLGIWSVLVGSEGRVFGLDKSIELLSVARGKSYTWDNVRLIKADMDKDLPLRRDSLDWVIACFSIYYVRSAEAVIRNSEHVLSPGGKLVLVGPTQNNARELYTFNEKITGVGVNPQALARASRLEREFLPVLGSIFSEVKATILPNKLVFPAVSDFVEYYLSTPLFQESRSCSEIDYAGIARTAVGLGELVVSKETIIIQARKTT